MDEFPGLGPGDPSGVPIRVGDPPVERRRQLQSDKGARLFPVGVEKDRVLEGCRAFEQSELDLDTGRSKPRRASRGYWIRIGQRRDDSPHAGRDEGLGAGWLLSLVCARLQGHHHRGASRRLAGLGQRHNLGVGAAVFRVPSLAHDRPILHDHRSDERIRLHPTPSSPGELERAGHRLLFVHRQRRANRTADAPRRISPITQVATPSARAADCAAATASRGRTAMSPMPRLKTSRISSIETCPACCSVTKSGGSSHASGSTSASQSAGKYPDEIARNASAGDVSQPVHPVEHRSDAPVVAAVHREQCIGDRLPGVAEDVVELEAHPVEDDPPGQRIPVGVQPGGRVSQQDVARHDRVAVQSPILLDHADDRAREIVRPGLIQARHLRGLSPGQRHPVSPAAARDALDDAGDLLDARAPSPRCNP